MKCGYELPYHEPLLLITIYSDFFHFIEYVNLNISHFKFQIQQKSASNASNTCNNFHQIIIQLNAPKYVIAFPIKHEFFLNILRN